MTPAIATALPVPLQILIERELRLSQPVLLEGWFTADRGKELAQLVLDHQPETIVEIGTFGARSTICMGLACRELGHGKVYAIDPWRKEAALEFENEANREWWNKVNLHEIHKGAMEAIWRLGLEEWIVVIRSRSEHCPQLFGGGIDLLLVDGNHSEAASSRDVTLYAPQLREGSIVIMDDTDWETTKKAQQLLEEYCSVLKVSEDGHYKIYKRG